MEGAELSSYLVSFALCMLLTGLYANICIVYMKRNSTVVASACTHTWQQLLACRILLGLGFGVKAVVGWWQ